MGRHTKAKSSTITLNGVELARGSKVSRAQAPFLRYTAAPPKPSPQLQAARLGPRPGHQQVVMGVKGKERAKLVPSKRPSKQSKRVKAKS